MRIVLALIASLALAACGGAGSGNSSAEAPAAAKVAPPAGKKWVDVVTRTPEGGMLQGNPNAPIKLVEYGSRSCPACQAFALSAVEPLRANYVSTGQVSYEFRDFALHPQDLGLILIGNCITSNEAFFPILDAMYVEQQGFNDKLQQIPQDEFSRMQAMGAGPQAKRFMELLGYIPFMKQRGVSQTQLDQCLADQGKIAQVAKQVQGGVDKGVTGTPSFFINDVKFEGNWDDMQTRLRTLGAR